MTKDKLEIVELESTGKELVEVIEQVTSPASDGIEDKIVVSIDNAATDVVKELEAVENVAESIVKKVENDATSLASLGKIVIQSGPSYHQILILFLSVNQTLL